MKPTKFVNDLGKEYFDALFSILKKRGIADSSYEIELSILSMEYAKYHEAIKNGEEEGYYNRFQNGQVQVNAHHTRCKDALASIQKLSPKFGLTPKDYDSIKSQIKEEKLKPKFKD